MAIEIAGHGHMVAARLYRVGKRVVVRGDVKGVGNIVESMGKGVIVS